MGNTHTHTHNKVVVKAKNSSSSQGKKSQSAMEYLKLLGKVSSKSQSAMEYLMTYGWAILIIAVVLIALFQLGVFNSSNFAPKAQPGSCQVFKTVEGISLEGTCNNMLPQYVANLGSLGEVSLSPVPTILEPARVTIAIWFYESSYDVCYPNEGAGIHWSQGYFILQPCSNFGVVIGSGTEAYVQASGTPFVGTWHQEAATFDGANIILYVDGKLINSGPSPAITYNGVTQFIIASPANPEMMEANLQIYNTSLSSNDVQALYQEGIGGVPINTQNLVGWWPLNGNANDYSGNNNNGAATNVIYSGSWESGYSQP